MDQIKILFYIMKGVLVKTAVYHNVSEEKFILQCEDMKEIFCEIMLAKNIKEKLE
jgi:hypothetical protein